MEVTLSSNVFLLIYLYSAVRTPILCLFEVYLSYDPSCLSVGRLAGCRSVCRNFWQGRLHFHAPTETARTGCSLNIPFFLKLTPIGKKEKDQSPEYFKILRKNTIFNVHPVLQTYLYKKISKSKNYIHICTYVQYMYMTLFALKEIFIKKHFNNLLLGNFVSSFDNLLYHICEEEKNLKSNLNLILRPTQLV